jgi:purine catabolism regulator
MRSPDPDYAYAPVTVAEILDEPALAGTTVVAGRSGLARELTDVCVLDLGELDAVRPGQLVLSSAYPLQESDLGELLGRLRREGACAFGIKRRGFWLEMPAELVETADVAGVPLLDLPPGRFEDLVNPVLTLIAERQAERLRRSALLHQALTEAALREETPAAIARVVMHALGQPVAVFNEREELLTSTGPDALWTSTELVERSLSADEPVELVVDGTPYLAAPITGARGRYGAMCVAGVTKTDSFARAAVAQATVVTAVQIIGQQGIDALHRRYERELLDELADGRLGRVEARRRARRVGWPLRRPYVILVAQRRTPKVRIDTAAPGLLSDAELAAFSRAIPIVAGDARVFRRQSTLAVVLHVAKLQSARRAGASVAKAMIDCTDVGWASRDLVIGASRPHTAITDFAAAFRQAMLSANVRSSTTHEPTLSWFEDLGPMRLLAAVQDRQALVRMANEILEPVTDIDAAGERDLVATLQVLLAHNMRLSDAADELYFHYNTVRHRLARLREALGGRLDGPLQRATLTLALSALDLQASEDQSGVSFRRVG